MTPATKKLLTSLSASDLSAFPVWKVIPEEHEDGALVQPLTAPSKGQAHYVVGAEVTLSNGTECPAFVHVAHYGTYVDLGPVVLFQEGAQRPINASNPAFGFWPSTDERGLLPLKWILKCTLEGESAPRSGSVSSSRIVAYFRTLIRQSRLGSIQRSTRDD